MEEAFLHYVWQQGVFDLSNLRTAGTEPLVLHSRGLPNRDSGPDFSSARIRIGDQEWAGHVEIHIRTSDWDKHGHQYDKAYNNVILHVVYENNVVIRRQDGTIIPCLELKPRISPRCYDSFESMKQSLQFIPCASQAPSETGMNMNSAMHRALTDRLLVKAARVTTLCESLGHDWQNAFYITLARYLGFKVNADAMEKLAMITPNALLARHRNEPLQVEALLYGQAGMLEEHCRDEYFLELKREYAFLQKKYGLQPMSPLHWKFMRMRPVNFPSIRISQLAGLVVNPMHLFSKILEEKNAKELLKYFEADASEYWETHFRFGKISKIKTRHIGKTSLEGLLINAVSPVLFAYGKHRQDEVLMERAFDLLACLKPENNRITREYMGAGFNNNTAYESQALLGLNELYCKQKKCLECAIGMKLIGGF